MDNSELSVGAHPLVSIGVCYRVCQRLYSAIFFNVYLKSLIVIIIMYLR
jgi:hypothetical protein